MAVSDLSDEQIEARLNLVEEKIQRADVKDLPTLNNIFQMLIEEQVRRDLNTSLHNKKGNK